MVYPGGLAICFKTNSPSIAAKWVTTKVNLSSNLTLIVNAGLDLYIKKTVNGCGPVWEARRWGVPNISRGW